MTVCERAWRFFAANFAGPLFLSQVKMHGLNTPFSTTWFLAPYCAWLGYGAFLLCAICSF